MYGLGVILLCSAAGIALALFVEDEGWMTFWGVVVLTAIIASGVASVRYIRLPVDEDYGTAPPSSRE